MRISDWSSDVCSSDLRARNAEIGQVNWLDPKLPTIARLLQRNGYKTAHIGKWHLGGGRDIGDAPWPTAYGFAKSFTTFAGLGPRVLVSDEERFLRSEEHTSELQSLMRSSYSVFCLKKKK